MHKDPDTGNDRNSQILSIPHYRVQIHQARQQLDI